jgi:hypothetical protein
VDDICAAIGIKVRDLFCDPHREQKSEPPIVRNVKRQIDKELRGRLTRRDRERPVTVVLAQRTNPEMALAWALALAVEGELVQVVFGDGKE